METDWQVAKDLYASKKIHVRAVILSLVESAGDRIVYFAHSRLAYGTKAALDARKVIETARPGCRLLDASRFDRPTPIWERLVQLVGSYDTVTRLVVSCVDEVIALEHDNHVGRGVYSELAEAALYNKPCSVVRGGAILPVARLEFVDVNDWRRRYGRVVVG